MVPYGLFLAKSKVSDDETLGALYHSLDLGNDDGKIRVLDLHPSKWPMKLEGTLRLVDRSSNPSYEALSYTWGASPRRKTILINQRYLMRITDNLHQALYRLRLRSESRTIWADAICINQRDDREKGHQVKRMGTTFQNASCVNVWLGEPGWVSPIRQRYLLRPLEMYFRTECDLVDAALRNSLPAWHTRAWIAQEFIMAQEIFYCWGNRRRPEIAGLDDPRSSSRGLRLGWAFGEQVKGLVKIKNQINTSEKRIGVFEAFILLRASASDPRDLIYSKYAFLDPDERLLFEPDYSLECWEVFATATFVSIRSRQSFDILLFAPRPWLRRRVEEVPTWAINFEALMRQPQISNVEKLNQDSVTPEMCATSSKGPRKELEIALDPSRRFLTIAGIRCGAVSEVWHVDGGRAVPIYDEFLTFVHSCFSAANEILRQNPSESGKISATQRLIHDWAAYQGHGHLDPSSVQTWQNHAADAVVDAIRTSEFDISSYVLLEAFSRLASDIQRLSFWRYTPNLLGFSRKQCVFLSDSGIFGFSDSEVVAGDTIVLVQGQTPFLILRQKDAMYEFKGTAWIVQQVKSVPWDDLVASGIESEQFTLC